MAEVTVVEDFHGVYLLYCINPKYKGRTYIGYTRDPLRRIKQHNRGTWAGGAWRTNNKGPWKMVLIVHGFPNNISALRFEWAWQNPTKTTRLQHLNLKRIPRKESELQFKLRIMSEMLRVGPWWRLPLSLQWLEADFFTELPADKSPPEHMPICHGKIKSRNMKAQEVTQPIAIECLLCAKTITDTKFKLTCLNSDCELVSHITCLANLWLTPGEYVPISGKCPFCDKILKWGDLIRKSKGFCESMASSQANDDDDDEKCVENDEGNTDDDDGNIVDDQEKAFVDNHSWFLDCNEDL